MSVNVTIRGRNVQCKVWKLEGFRQRSALPADTDVPGQRGRLDHRPALRLVWEERIAQEMVLGIGASAARPGHRFGCLPF